MAWIREELRVSDRVRLFRWLVAEKSRSFALDWFKDGAGYVLAARAWVPFASVPRAFVLYACWEQANLRGNPVTLLKLEEGEAVLEIDAIHFKLYRETGHLRQQISWEDYRQLFETTWHDRADHGGWKLDITHDGETSRFHCVR